MLRVETRLNQLVSRAAGESGVVSNLASLGVRSNEFGQLEFDPDRFDALAETDPEELAAFFTGDEGFGTKLDALVESLTDSSRRRLYRPQRHARQPASRHHRPRGQT